MLLVIANGIWLTGAGLIEKELIVAWLIKVGLNEQGLITAGLRGVQLNEKGLIAARHIGEGIIVLA